VNVFCVRPRRFNVGNETIAVAVRGLLRQTLAGTPNLVPIPALVSEEEGSLAGLTARTVHQMNLYGQGVVVGGGNLYENGQLDLEPDALACLLPPLLLIGLSYGRIYDARGRLVRRTDAMADSAIRALDARAMRSLVRDDATLAHLRSLGLDDAQVGGCPTLWLDRLAAPPPAMPGHDGTVLLAIRDPRLMNIPVRNQARVHGDVARLIEALRAEDAGRVVLLCNDKRDLAFASSFEDIEYVLPDDVGTYLGQLRAARLVVSFRLHAFIPCLSYGTPAINISYDERSAGLLRTLGISEWDVAYLDEPDIAATVLRRIRDLPLLDRLIDGARPTWDGLEAVTRAAASDVAEAVAG
jgi:hypothetical protein